MMFNQVQYTDMFDRESYRNINRIHEDIENELDSDYPDKGKLQDLYLQELNNALFLGGRLTKDYGAGCPF